MLQTRLWMGAVLVGLTVGALIVDQALAPWYPFLLIVVAGLAYVSTWELLNLLPLNQRPPFWLCLVGIGSICAANWLPHLPWWPLRFGAWQMIAACIGAFLMLAFIVEMAAFREPGKSVTRLAMATWVVAYLGLLPSFFAQQRWTGTATQNGAAALALTIFVPKVCDIGAYITGRTMGRRPMTPILSPKKTWEGACGGLAAAVATAIILDRVGPAPVLRENWAIEVGFGLSVGIAGIIGDLAESLVKRDMQHKDASQSVPGFGGVLDVIDAILFAAPVSYLWFELVNQPMAV